MGAGREGLRKRVFARLGFHEFGQRGAIDGALVRQLLGQRDGLAVMVQVHQHGHVLLRPAGAQVHAIHQAIQHVRGIEFAIDQLIAHAGPGCFLAGHDLDAIFLVKAQHRRHDDRRAIGQWNKADFDFFFFRLVRAGSPHALRGQSGDGSGGAGLQQGTAGEFEVVVHPVESP
jgi:hypothetical protein